MLEILTIILQCMYLSHILLTLVLVIVVTAIILSKINQICLCYLF